MRLWRRLTRLPTRVISQLLQAPTIVVLNLWSPDTPEEKKFRKKFKKNIFRSW